ncbi:MAG TPA: response regulator [Candidatus Paceibacterota bacterium]
MCRPKKVILLVGDNEQELSVLKFTLATNGYSVLAATNSSEAVDVFKSAPSIDLVIADFGMSTTNGTPLAERLNRLNSNVPIILLGNPAEMSNDPFPANALLAKTISSTELLERVKFMTARKRGPRKKVPTQEPAASNRLVAQGVYT